MGHTGLTPINRRAGSTPPICVGGNRSILGAFLYHCPIVGIRVQGWVADEPPADDDNYVTVTCLACRQVHLVKPSSGKVLRTDED